MLSLREHDHVSIAVVTLLLRESHLLLDRASGSAQGRALNLVNTLGDLRVTVGALTLGQSPRTSHSSSMPCAVELSDYGAGPSRRGPSVSFGTPGSIALLLYNSELIGSPK